jgi:hypothetical protein
MALPWKASEGTGRKKYGYSFELESRGEVAEYLRKSWVRQVAHRDLENGGSARDVRHAGRAEALEGVLDGGRDAGVGSAHHHVGALAVESVRGHLQSCREPSSSIVLGVHDLPLELGVGEQVGAGVDLLERHERTHEVVVARGGVDVLLSVERVEGEKPAHAELLGHVRHVLDLRPGAVFVRLAGRVDNVIGSHTGAVNESGGLVPVTEVVEAGSVVVLDGETCAGRRGRRS